MCFILAGALLAADLLTKHLIFLHPESIRTVIPGMLNFAPNRNAGAVFGLGQGMRPVFITFTIVAVGVMLWVMRKYGPGSRLLTVGLGLLLGGALGNLYDRITASTVRDFIDFYVGDWHWATFNLADCGVSIGCGILILHSFLTPSADSKLAPPAK